MWEANFDGERKADISWRYFRKFDSEINFKSAVKKHESSATSVMTRQEAKICRRHPRFFSISAGWSVRIKNNFRSEEYCGNDFTKLRQDFKILVKFERQ
jgi:hypothetical protein